MNRSLATQAEAMQKIVRPAIDALTAQTAALNRSLAPLAQRQAAVAAEAALASKRITAFAGAVVPPADFKGAFASITGALAPSLKLTGDWSSPTLKLLADSGITS